MLELTDSSTAHSCCCCCCWTCWQVVVAVPVTLRATWEGSGSTPTVQLGGQINDLTIRAFNASNEVSTATATQQQLLAICSAFAVGDMAAGRSEMML
jgi:hypothetical protein